ncbi:MAG: divergent PAP2 family protein [Candidatus Woesearchaeota archaeon]
MILYYFLTITIAWILSVIIKASISKSFKAGFKNGGMPSQHTTAISSITFAILFAEGLTSTFFLAIVLLSIIMVDASGLRYSVGKQGTLLNSLVKKPEDKLELVNGHTKKQVFYGLLLGFFTALTIFLIMF